MSICVGGTGVLCWVWSVLHCGLLGLFKEFNVKWDAGMGFGQLFRHETFELHSVQTRGVLIVHDEVVILKRQNGSCNGRDDHDQGSSNDQPHFWAVPPRPIIESVWRFSHDGFYNDSWL